ncbi:Inositol-pentakisphosphate 2-kinase [Chlorella vulgaris]
MSARLATSCDLERPELWSLKGEGNANWVFSYAGTSPNLVGKVLRVRKPKPPPEPEHLALEDAVWGPVLGNRAAADGSDSAADRERAYVQLLLAPLLGPQHIPLQQQVYPSLKFLQRLLHCSGCLWSLPDGKVGVAGVAAPLPAVLMPDVTLLPASSPSGTSGSVAEGAAGPVVCIELKPKCGFINTCSTVHPANRGLKHSRSRYQLHQLLKLEEGSIDACSTYDPCDLFSGEPGRLRAALAALLEQPQNNLRLFLGGQSQQLPQRPQTCAETGAAGEPAGEQQVPQHAAPQQVAQQQEQQQNRPQQQPQEREQARAGAALEALLVGLLPQPYGQRRGALVELLAAVLEVEGVLPRLLQAQQQCPYDVEGVYQLYCSLAGVTGTLSSASTCSTAAEGLDDASDTDAATDADAGSHVAALQQLLALPLHKAYAVLRSYVVAATAKDCAIMITLQRLTGAAAPAATAAAGADGSLHSSNDGTSPQHLSRHGPLGCIYSSAAGAWYAYQLALVDLDQKALAKIVKHSELDAAILVAARRHLAAHHDDG